MSQFSQYPPNPNQPKRLTRSMSERWIAGVCGGIAQRFNLDPTIVRLAFAALALFGVLPGVLAYVAAGIIMPEEF